MKLSRFLALLLLIHALSAVAQTPSSGSKIISLPVMSPNTPQGTEGGFWKVDGSFEPILRLKNDLLKQSLSVTPILYFADGTPYPLSPVLLDPAGVAQVNIRMALQSVPPNLQSHLSNYGMTGISYQWSWPAVIATIQNIDEVASLTTTSSSRSDVRTVHVTPEVSSAQVIRGQWWLPTANADGYVALENTSLTPKQASVHFLGHTGNSLATQQVALASHSTALIKLSAVLRGAQSTETFGGIEIDYTGPDQGVLAYAGIEDPTVGYSASPQLTEEHLDPSRPVHQVTLSAPGLKLGSPNPVMLFPAESYFKPYAYLHNVSANPLQVTLSLVIPGSGGAPQTYALGQVSLQPGQTSHFDFDAQFSSANPLPDGSGHLTASFQGRDGDLQLATGSVDQTQSYVFEVNPSQQADSASRTLCFWSIEGDNDSTITVWNYKPTAQDLVLTLYYFHGQYAIPIHLGPNESYNLDMASLVHSRAPDPSGTLIPSNIDVGSALLSGPGGDLDKISVAVSASVFNVRNATCGYVCISCNGVVSMVYYTSPITVPIGTSTQATVELTMNTGSVINNPSGGTWSTSAPGVATVNSTGVHTGVSGGSTTSTFYITNVYPGFTMCGPAGISCPVEYTSLSASAPVTVPDQTPVITGIDPSVWDSSTSTPVTTPNVTFTGQYFGTNAPTLNFSDPTIGYTLLSNSDVQIVANVTVAAGTPNEDVAVSVTNNGYGGSAFAPGSTGNSATSAPNGARVQSPSNTPQITVIGWVNGQAPDIVAAVSNGPTTQLLKTNLTSGSSSCLLQMFGWLEGNPDPIESQTDVSYANAWLLQQSANPAPSTTSPITPVVLQSAGNFRIFNDFGAGQGFFQVGSTPSPCGGVTASWYQPTGQLNPNSGPKVSGSGQVYQMSEGRVGQVGQAISQTINGQSVPWIWSVIEFNSSGVPAYSQVGMFPTYTVYSNGVFVTTYPQSTVAAFVANNTTYQQNTTLIP